MQGRGEHIVDGRVGVSTSGEEQILGSQPFVQPARSEAKAAALYIAQGDGTYRCRSKRGANCKRHETECIRVSETQLGKDSGQPGRGDIVGGATRM